MYVHICTYTHIYIYSYIVTHRYRKKKIQFCDIKNLANFFWKIREFGQIYTIKKNSRKFPKFFNKKHDQICPIKSPKWGWWIREDDWHAQKSVGNAESSLERTFGCFLLNGIQWLKKDWNLKKCRKSGIRINGP
jgi:hypothetical protein